MRVFAVGATGVLGGALVPMLVERGHRVTVLAPDRLEALPPEVARVRGGLLDDHIRLEELIAGDDAVVNLATSMPRNPAAPGAWRETSRIRGEGTSRLVTAARAAGVRRLVQMSITMAYPDGGDTWLTEDTPLDPDPARRAVVGPVAELESTLGAVSPSELAWTVLRGSRFAGSGTVQDTQRELLARGEMRIPGDGGSYVSMVHVADYARAVLAALEGDAAGRVLNVSDTPVTTGEYLTELARRTGCPPPEHDRDAAPDLPSQRVDSGAVLRELGWRPRHGIWPPADGRDGW
ncbi:NADH dehydrogenase [Haloactinospora alba]|uniref:NADH dehydrogenase n=1 Tax=Haloactinospora alba TaxID=405555 RepID=A0A543N905_9ACTN|nr:NAD(P)-dependent oxidoreductase [Haloactinospora alba]TQN28290.1 NADH dehydrogenase [Haloactinospora alba]